MHNMDNQREHIVEHRGLYLMYYGDLNGKEVQKGGDICTCMVIHFAVQQKLTQHCKVTILQ